MRKSLSKAIALSLVTFSVFWHIFNTFSSKTSSITSITPNTRQEPLILFYNNLFRKGDGRKPPDDFNSDYINCSYQCRFTSIVAKAKLANVVIFNINRNLESIRRATIKHFRKPEQLWIMFSWESPMQWDIAPQSQVPLRQLDNVFNWTWTYRLDSDVVFSYGRFLKKVKADTAKTYDRLSGKTKSAIFLAGNCIPFSTRNSYLAGLIRAGGEIDIVGECRDRFRKVGNLSENFIKICSRNALFSTSSECERLIESTYKFYLSFENSLCRDYVTEKFYRPASLNIIPVVMNGADMSLFTPERTHIDVRDFAGPVELVKYLNRVGSNNDLYNSYFSWKSFYEVEHTFDKLTYYKNICELCRKVNEHMRMPNTKVYANIEDWFIWKSNCSRPRDTG